MRILHVFDHSVPLQSGYSFRSLAILKEQRRLGWETFHLTSSKHRGATADEEVVDGFRFHRTRVSLKGWRAAPLLDQYAVIRDTRRRLEQVVVETRPDIIHAHSPCLNGLAALRIARRHQLPLVYEVRAFWEDAAVDHGTTSEGSLRYRLSRALETHVLKRADAVTTICEGLRAEIIARGVSPERVTEIPNAVDPDEFPLIEAPDGALKNRLGLGDTFTIGFIGSFYAYEGLDILIAALPEILAFEPRTRLLLVGGGPEENSLRVQTRDLNLNDKVVFTGRVPHGEVARYYSVVDLLAFPRKSMRLTETVTPLKPLEAMALGRPLIASNVGGHRELIVDGKTGFLFAHGQPDALARTVSLVRSIPQCWPEMRAAARQFVLQKRNWTASVARYETVYAAALAVSRRH